ncbi:Hypothetical predicted protein [Mytilus galloprovincialis]|uniref:Death domain-containing protein n=1 Tax=Mytilus galloprovincialis TaxID=29158 RepID=A0A8B6ET21_MYTGA|nr:Hypothetical predicted protein [Mytilus galloprovincialis]
MFNNNQVSFKCWIHCINIIFFTQTGLQEGALNQVPSDIELQRFASGCDDITIKELAIRLGMSFQEWDELERNNPDYIQIVKYRILVNWREKWSGKFSNIAQALTEMKLTTHKLCQVRSRDETYYTYVISGRVAEMKRTTHMLCQVKRIRKVQCDISEENLDLIPTDEILDELAQVLGVVSFQLGIELGLLSTALDAIQYNNGRNLVAQCKEILFQWRINEKVRPTIRVLVQALVNVGRGASCLEKIIKKVGVKAYIPHEEVEEQKQGKVATLLKKLNLFQKKN